MSDNGLELELFREAYDKAVAANKRGDIQTARRYFLRAAELMESVAEKSEPSLASTRRERAQKLRFIGENLTAEQTDEKDESDAPSLLNTAPPTDKVTFDEIVGLEEAKAAIHRLLIDPLKNPEVYAKYGIKAGGFILLEGPPGTGKTTFAKAAATELELPFSEINSNALVDSYIGKTGKNIDKLFAEARALAKKTGTPVVLFLDEIDYLAQRRGGDNKTAAEAVPTLIKQMDGFSTGADDLVLIAATNIKEALDPAILSRFRNVINIPLPTSGEREKLFGLKLAVLSAEDTAQLDLKAAAEASDGLSGRDIAQVAMDLKNALAARDAGISAIGMPIGELLIKLINKHR